MFIGSSLCIHQNSASFAPSNIGDFPLSKVVWEPYKFRDLGQILRFFHLLDFCVVCKPCNNFDDSPTQSVIFVCPDQSFPLRPISKVWINKFGISHQPTDYPQKLLWPKFGCKSESVWAPSQNWNTNATSRDFGRVKKDDHWPTSVYIFFLWVIDIFPSRVCNASANLKSFLYVALSYFTVVLDILWLESIPWN